MTLENEHARLEPMGEEHAAGLLEAGLEPEMWAYLPTTRPQTLEQMLGYIRGCLALREAGTEMPFVIVAPRTGRVAGSTRLMDIRAAHRGVEIGWTWVGAAWRRTGVNTSCKYLLLRHVFEDLAGVRVQLKCDERNARSRAAIERIGGRYEGTLRSTMVLPDGHRRNTTYYSIIETEWPGAGGVKERLEGMLRRGVPA